LVYSTRILFRKDKEDVRKTEEGNIEKGTKKDRKKIIQEYMEEE
jgi:hypothetical protein